MYFLVSLSIADYKPWREGMDICKKKNAYPIGNITLSDSTLSCVDLNNTDPRWIGIVRDQFIGTDHGKNIGIIMYMTCSTRILSSERK